jgi:uncharacterized protein (DUF1697 family)
MPAYVAFLRAVNIGKRQYPMAELRQALVAAGFEEVETYIQTGNVRFRTRMRSRPKVIAALQEVFREDRGFEVPVVLMTPSELKEVYDEACAFAADLTTRGNHLTGHYVTLLAEPPAVSLAAALEAGSTPGEEVRVGVRAVHLLLDKPYHEVSTSNAVVERQLGVATTRNLTVITKLTEKWGP